jgi:aminopeptidase N
MRPVFWDDVDRLDDRTYYDISVTLDPRAARLSGTQVVRYTNREEDSLSELVFRLLPNTPSYGGALSVTGVTVTGADVETRLDLGDSVLIVPLDTPLAPSEQIEIALAYEGTLPTDGTAGYAQYGFIDGVLALPSFYPYLPVYDDEGWNVELGPTYGDATFTDTSFYVLTVTLPADFVLAASGTVIDRTLQDGLAQVTIASGPVRDINLVASAAYKMVQEQVDDVTVTSYYTGDDTGGKRALDYAVHALEIYQELIGPYPFAELDVVATPTKAGGIEYPGLIVVAESLYGEDGGFFEFATVHEVAHQWWYSLVGSDQLDEPWLDEALTQYTSLLYFERRYGAEAAQAILDGYFYGPYDWLQRVEEDMPAGLPVADYSADLYGPVVYGKGPLFFHELRTLVGEEAFIEILRVYFEGFRYGVAYPQDLMDVAEQVSGQDLDALYEEWIADKEAK